MFELFLQLRGAACALAHCGTLRGMMGATGKVSSCFCTLHLSDMRNINIYIYIVVEEFQFRGKGNNVLFDQLIHNKEHSVIFSSKEKGCGTACLHWPGNQDPDGEVFRMLGSICGP